MFKQFEPVANIVRWIAILSLVGSILVPVVSLPKMEQDLENLKTAKANANIAMAEMQKDIAYIKEGVNRLLKNR